MASFPGQKAGAAPTAPTTPSNLIAAALPSATQIQLQWNASQDGDLSISYIVTRCSGTGCTNFTALATTVPNSVNYIDSGLSVNSSYSYVVQAIDGAGNLSGLSNIATAVTPPLPQTLASISTTNTGNRWPVDTWAAQGGARRAAVLAPVLAPSIPANFAATVVSSSEIDLSWSASTEPNVAISLYTIIISPGNITAQISAPATTFKDTGLTASTTYTYTLSATDVNGNTSGTTQTSATTQAGVSPLSSPRVGIVAYGGDQGYGQPTTSGFTSYTASVPGTAAYTAMQQLGAYDVALINGSFESWGTSSSGRTKTNLVQAIKGKGNFANIINSVRTPFVFLYSIMESAQNLSSGAAYQGYSTQIINNNWWLYPTAGGSGTPVGSAASGSGWFDVDYTYFYPVAPSGFSIDTPVVGHVYGSLSSAQSAAQTAATYFSTALLSTNRSDARFSSLPLNGSAPNADGLFLDNCFIYPNGGGNLSPSTASWDGVSTQSNTAIGPYTGNSGSPVSSMLARGQLHFFQQYQSFLANVNPGSVYYNIANFGGFADITSFGNTHTAVSSAIDGTFHGGLLEEVAGVAGPSWQSFRTWAQVLANINNAVAYCQAPQLVLVGVKLPASDGSTTASFFTGGTNVTVTANTALEYQFLRCMFCATLMTNAIFATGTSTYNYSVTRYYDEFGDDSLTQVNVKKGYLGVPVSAVPTAAAFSNGVWGRLYPNAVVLFNPWSNGAQTITAAQMTTLYGHNFLTLKGTQQTSVNAGRVFTAFTFGDGDGLILLIDTAVTLSITTTSLPNATVGSAYTTSLAATGGTAPYAYAITSDTPDTGGWLSINPSTGALTGTPGTAETESVTFQVTDALGRVATKTLPLVVTAAGSFTFAPNLPAGFTQIWKRVFNKTDSAIPGGVLPPASLPSSGRDSYGMSWLAGDGTTVVPIIDTPANLTTTVGAPVTAPPDGNSTVLAVHYPLGYPATQCPFFISPTAFSGFNKIYACFLVYIPTNFATDGNNIKWMDCDAGVSNDIFMLIGGNGGTGTNADNRMVWQTLQGPVSGNPGGPGGGPTGATIRAQLTPSNPPPQGTGPGWLNSCLGQWLMCEWLADITNGRLQTWITQAPFTTPFLVNDFSFSYGIAANSWNNATFCPYHGGGGGAASANMFIMVSGCAAYGSN